MFPAGSSESLGLVPPILVEKSKAFSEVVRRVTKEPWEEPRANRGKVVGKSKEEEVPAITARPRASMESAVAAIVVRERESAWPEPSTQIPSSGKMGATRRTNCKVTTRRGAFGRQGSAAGSVVKDGRGPMAKNEVDGKERRPHHVVPDLSGNWSVRRAGADRATRIFSTKGDAVAFATALARKAGSVLYVHSIDGSILDRDAFGGTPYPSQTTKG